MPDLSENYVPFDALPCVDHDEAEPQQFLGRLKEPAETSFDPQLYYVQFKSDSSEAAANNEGNCPIDTAAVTIFFRSSARL